MKRRCDSGSPFQLSVNICREARDESVLGGTLGSTQKKQNRNASRQENQRLSFVRSSVRSKRHIIDRKRITNVGER